MEKAVAYLKRCHPVKRAKTFLDEKKSAFHSRSFAHSQSTSEAGDKGFFKQRSWRFSKKAKGLIVFAILAVLLVSFFVYLPKGSQNVPDKPKETDNTIAEPTATAETNKSGSSLNPLSQWWSGVTSQAQNTITQAIGAPKGRGVIETAINAGQPLNSTVWKQVAQNAWNYFQIGVGVDSNTGLPSAGLGYPYFTDWDLGVYIQAVIDAQKMNLTSTTDANSRLDKVLTFLQTRDLNDATNYPFWFYQAKDGKDYQAQSDQATVTVDTVDTGRLFVALSNLKAYNPSWTDRINYIVYDRSNYAALIDGIKSDCAVSSSIYTYYVVSGFANFWPDQLINAPNTVLNNLFNAPNVTVSGVLLPKSPTSSEPLLCSLFELNSNDSRLAAFTRQVYLAHEAYYNASEQRQYVAFSEGNGPNGFIYEWVISPLGDSWKITPAADYTKYLDMNPIIYNKVALSFLALYNSTFARNMVVYLEQTLPNPTSGYSEGADNNGGVVSSVGSNTNGLILDAALYAIQNNP